MVWKFIDSLASDPGRFGNSNLLRTGASQISAYPPVNLYSTEERMVLTSEVPGMSIEDFDLSVKGNVLTLKGKRDLSNLGENGHFAHRERYNGAFERKLSLPFEIDSEKIEANYKTGVLRLDMPKAERAKPRRIEVTAV